MQPILQALQRRGIGPLGAGGAPMQQQASMPTHSLPGGGASTPVQGQQQPNGMLANMPSQVQQGGQGQQNGALQAGQQAQGPSFDPETRDLAKSLVQRLLKGL